LAETEPEKYMSIIIDGMAQNHTQLPYLANVKDFGDKKLDMHLEGVIEHGHSFTMYRTFNNIKADSNLIIHVILKQIEKRLQRYPRGDGAAPTLFLQVDGGPENANKFVLGLCEYLVARDIFSTVHLTRLPVGHTHEDIDARFGVLWRAIRDKTVITPQEYEQIMRKAFDTEVMKFYLEDIYAIPDYKEFFRPFLDSTLSGYTKLSQTQLCFRFERFEGDRINFPLCVRTMYRSYCTDKVYEIIEERNNPLIPIGFVASEVHSKWGPLATDSINDTNVDGIYVLKALPYGLFQPAKFEDDFLKGFKSTLEKARTMFRQFSETVQEWEQFAALYPNVETSQEYVLQPRARYELPMKDILFGYIDGIDSQFPDMSNLETESPADINHQIHGVVDPASRRFLATHAIRWHNRGRSQRALPNRLSIATDPSDMTRPIDLEAALIQQTSNVAMEEEALKVLNVSGLKAYCRLHGIVGFSGLKKDQLIAHIIAHRRNQNNTNAPGTASESNNNPQSSNPRSASSGRRRNPNNSNVDQTENSNALSAQGTSSESNPRINRRSASNGRRRNANNPNNTNNGEQSNTNNNNAISTSGEQGNNSNNTGSNARINRRSASNGRRRNANNANNTNNGDQSNTNNTNANSATNSNNTTSSSNERVIDMMIAMTAITNETNTS
jgi:hypothetical protein